MRRRSAVTRCGVRRVAVLGHHAEHRDGDVADRGRVRAAHREPVRGQHARGLPQQAGPVQRHHGHLAALDDRGRAALGDERELVLAQRRGLRHGLAVQHGGDPPYQVRDQAGLPVVPRRGAGGQPVRLTDSACSSSSSVLLPTASRRAGPSSGRRGPAGSPRRAAAGDGGPRPRPLPRPPRSARRGVPRRGPPPRRRRCGRPASPCRCRAAARRAAAGRAWPRRG